MSRRFPYKIEQAHRIDRRFASTLHANHRPRCATSLSADTIKQRAQLRYEALSGIAGNHRAEVDRSSANTGHFEESKEATNPELCS